MFGQSTMVEHLGHKIIKDKCLRLCNDFFCLFTLIQSCSEYFFLCAISWNSPKFLNRCCHCLFLQTVSYEHFYNRWHVAFSVQEHQLTFMYGGGGAGGAAGWDGCQARDHNRSAQVATFSLPTCQIWQQSVTNFRPPLCLFFMWRAPGLSLQKYIIRNNQSDFQAVSSWRN